MKISLFCTSFCIIISTLIFLSGCNFFGESDAEKEKALNARLSSRLKVSGTNWDQQIFGDVLELTRLESERVTTSGFRDTMISAMLNYIDTSGFDYSSGYQNIWSRKAEDTTVVNISRELLKGLNDENTALLFFKRNDLNRNQKLFMLVNCMEFPGKDSVIKSVFHPVTSADEAIKFLLLLNNVLHDMGEAYLMNYQSTSSEKIVMAAAALLDENSKWVNPRDARELYDLLKKFDPMIVVNELVKAVYKDEIRLRALYLGVKLGLPSTEERLNQVLLNFGNKAMAEDFLNCGSDRLYEGGRLWGEQNGYYITSGDGSSRIGWGDF